MCLQAVTHWTEKNAPFIFILFCVLISRHIVGELLLRPNYHSPRLVSITGIEVRQFAGLLVFASITVMLAMGNGFIRKQIALKEGRRIVRILLMMGLFAFAGPLLLLLPNTCLSWRAVVLLLPAKVDSVRVPDILPTKICMSCNVEG